MVLPPRSDGVVAKEVDDLCLIVKPLPNLNVGIGQRFRDKAEVIHFLGNYAITTKREHYCTRTEPKAYEVRCTKRPGCPFFVRAHKSNHEESFIIRRHTTHSCTTDSLRNMSRIVDARYVAQLVVTLVGSDISLTPKSIMEEVNTRTGMEISYITAWRGKQKAMNMLFGGFDAPFNHTPRLLQQIAITDPGPLSAMPDGRIS